MRHELQAGIKTALTGSAALTTALGSADMIVYGWPEVNMLKSLSSTNKAVLAWGADIISSAQNETGQSRTKAEPDANVSFHIFGYDPASVNGVADALYALLSEGTMTTTNYKCLRISCTGDVAMAESADEIELIHRILSFNYSSIWQK